MGKKENRKKFEKERNLIILEFYSCIFNNKGMFIFSRRVYRSNSFFFLLFGSIEI